MPTTDQRRFWWFLASCALAVGLTILGLDWFYAGFFFGVIMGGVVFHA